MSYITIFDFFTGEIHSFPYDTFMGLDFNEIAESIEDLYGVKFLEKNCQWMIQPNLNFKIHSRED